MRIRFFGRQEKESSPNVNPFAFRLHSRETFRAAALVCMIPFGAARMTAISH
jgi:hypothetical protein